MDLTPFLDPSRCAVTVFECQEAVLGERSQIPGLAKAVRDRDVIANRARCLESARAAGVGVYYLNVPPPTERPRLRPAPMTLRMEQTLGAMEPKQGEEDWSVLKEIAPEAGDVIVTRPRGGYSGFFATDLESQLVARGIETVVPVGVSLNLGIIGTSLDAAQRDFYVVIPSDCVVGDPPEYGDQVLHYALRNIAFISTSARISELWSARYARA